MKDISKLSVVAYLWLVAASTCFAQQYTFMDLGTLGGTQSAASGINASGQVVGSSYTAGDTYSHAFRTTANSPINPATDDLGTLAGTESDAFGGINASGQVAGSASTSTNDINSDHPFRTAPNSPINPATDDLGEFADQATFAFGINDFGQVVGNGKTQPGRAGFRTAPNSAIDPDTDNLGTLGGPDTLASGINNSGQVVGVSSTSSPTTSTNLHAFRTAPNSAINPATDDLSAMISSPSEATAINTSGQVVGEFIVGGYRHAFLTSPNNPIDAATDDLGTLGGLESVAAGINDFGQVVGFSDASDGSGHGFLYNSNVMYDLNDLIPPNSGWTVVAASTINNSGQIAATAANASSLTHAFLLTPMYQAFVQQPINADGSSIFKANRGVIPVKFILTMSGVPTCNLPAATIAVARIAGAVVGAVDENTFTMAADNGSNFRIDTTACQYIYNLAASPMGAGIYGVGISIGGFLVGHAEFALK